MYSLVQHYALVAFAFVLMVKFRDVMLHGGYCLSCGGHGAHRDDCPLKDDD